MFAGVLNFLGGFVFVDGVRLYDICFGFFKVDMLIYFLACFFVMLFLYDVFVGKIKGRVFSLVLIGGFVMGLGAFFEIFELLGIVLLGNDGVGDYFNNAIDLVLNFFGVLVASIWIFLRR